MKITLDTEKCTGHARCNAASPTLYVLDSDGYCSIREFDVPVGQEQAARDGAAACPERALTIHE